MKSQLNTQKTASSALLFTVFGMLAASFSPAVAATAVNKTTDAAAKSSIQGLSASTNLASLRNEAKITQTANLPLLAIAKTLLRPIDSSSVTKLTGSQSSPALANLSSVTNQAAGRDSINDEEGSIKSQENYAHSFSSIQSSSNSTLAFKNSKNLQNTEPFTVGKDLRFIAKEIKQPASKSSVTSDAGTPSQSQNPVINGDTLAASSCSRDVACNVSTTTQVKELTAPRVPKQQAISMSPDKSQEQPKAENSNPESQEDSAEIDDSMSQITNVSQLRDVRPGDWAYEALRELVERYGCIAGYPDGTFRGNRAMTRYEFAAGLRACLNQIEKLIASSTTGFVNKQDLEALQRLTQEFQAEIAALGTRVDKLDGRVGFLEAHQFSTTTRLFGQAIFGVQGRTKGNVNLAGFRFQNQNNINVIDNVQLSLLTQFSPRSILLTGLAVGNGFTGGFLPEFTSLGYELNTGNSFILSDLTYRQLIGNNFAAIIGPAGVNPVNVFRGVNRVEGSGQGPLSLFAQRNPIINIGSPRGRVGVGQAGIGFDWQIIPRASLQAVYSAGNPQDPALGGLFGGTDGTTTIGTQLTVSPLDTLDISLDYLNAYSHDGFLGTGVGDDQLALSNRLDNRVALKTNAFGGTIEWRITPSFTIGGWGGYTTSHVPGERGSVQTINWMGFLNFPDLLGRGNLAGFYVGQPPRIINSSLSVSNGRNIPRFVSQGINAEGGELNRTLHLEAFYRLRVTDNISVTPGVIVLLHPGHNSANDNETIGALRTTFSF